MRISRGVVAIVGGSVAVLAASIASCAVEGDVFTLLPDADVSPRDSASFDSALPDLGVDTAPVDVDLFDGGLDGAWIHCLPDACHVTSDECCIYGSLDPFCTPAGTCGDGGKVECDRASMCDAGQLCCAHMAAFSFFGKCDPSCAGAQLCESNHECVDGGHCAEGGVFAVCQWD